MLASFVLDRSSILERLGGDEEIYAMMVDMYLQDVDRNCDELAAALATSEAVEVRRAVHTVKGLLATFSDETGAAFALACEDRVKQGQLGGAGEAIETLQQRLREVASALTAE